MGDQMRVIKQSAIVSAASVVMCGWLSSLAAASSAETDVQITARVNHALDYTSDKLLSKLLNSGLAFHWIGASDRFWYRKSMKNAESEFLLVDAATGHQKPLFELRAMTGALTAAGADAIQGAVSIQTISVDEDVRTMTVTVRQEEAPCRWPVYGNDCSKPTQQFKCTLTAPSCSLMASRSDSESIPSPDGTHAIFVRAHNLWLRNLKGGAERQLTTAGVENFAYGRVHLQGDTWEAARRRAKEPKPLQGILWSPNGRFIFALRHDLRKTPERLVITEYVPPEGGSPVVHTDRLAVAGDPEYPPATLEIIDVTTGAVRPVPVDPHAFEDLGMMYFASGKVWWSRQGGAAWIIGTPRGGNRLTLTRVDLASGQTHDVVVEESARPLLLNPSLGRSPNVIPLESSNQLIWYSERDGWGHLYLYDLASGKVVRQITRGNWLVADVMRIDEKSRSIYFTAVGKEQGWNPYYRALYRVGIDGGEPVLLTADNADHDFKDVQSAASEDSPGGSISPSGRYVIDSFSTTRTPDRVVLRRIDGKAISEVVTADPAALLAAGWRPPEPFTVKAADGKTDLYGILYAPQSMDPAKKYPVIEITYPGPWWKESPTKFKDSLTAEPHTGSTVLNANAMAELGAIVVAVDGRGNAYRSAEFHNAFLHSDDAVGAIDHMTAIRELGSQRTYMDLTRVGATGHSSGGDGSLRAMLLYPDFFKVVVSGEGPTDYLCERRLRTA
jgi:hypothetical protein